MADEIHAERDQSDSRGRLERALDRMEAADRDRIMRSLIMNGHCVHSFFVQDCNGCREREMHRALGALVDLHQHGFTTPTHGLDVEGEDDLWRFAAQTLEHCRS